MPSLELASFSGPSQLLLSYDGCEIALPSKDVLAHIGEIMFTLQETLEAYYLLNQ